MRRIVITQTLIDVPGEEQHSGETSVTLLSIFNKAMQSSGFGALEYHNTILTSVELKEL